MNLLSILKNPLFSLEKFIRGMNKAPFINAYNKKIEAIREANSRSIDLDSMFEDTRHLVGSDIDKIKVISMKILAMIDYLAQEYNFNYFMSYGTLIGVVRHQGFIPWDDDIDLMMTKQDLEKLISVSHQLPSSIKFFAQGLNFLKVMDKYSKMSIDGMRGVAVDIFVLDGDQEQYSFVNVHTQRKIYLKGVDVFPLQKLPFEKRQVPVPANYHELLTDIYGDYMKLPPEEKRVSHHVNNTSVHISPFPKTKIQ